MTITRSRLANQFEILHDYYRTFSEDYKKIRDYNSKLIEKLQSAENSQVSIYNEIKQFVNQQQSILNQPVTAAEKAEVKDITHSQIIADNAEIDQLSKQLTLDPKNTALLDQLLKMVGAQNRKIFLLDKSLADHKKYLSAQVKRFSFSLGEQFPLVVFNEGEQAKQSGQGNSSVANRNSEGGKNVNIFGVDSSNGDGLKVSELHTGFSEDAVRNEMSMSNGTGQDIGLKG